MAIKAKEYTCTCEDCTFTVEYDTRDVSEEPKFCPFCGESLDPVYIEDKVGDFVWEDDLD